jgi:hypothetical protein
MSELLFVGLALLGVVAVGWSIYDFLESGQKLVAPDNADRDAINAEHGEGTAGSRKALRERFGPGSHWRDAATGLSVLIGLIVLFWLWFG